MKIPCIMRVISATLALYAAFALTKTISAANDIVLSPPVVTVPSNFFGMHIGRAGITSPWPAVRFGAWRLWDAFVSWPYLEPNKGKWHFDDLDTYVTLAQSHNVELLLPLGLSPTWASARPNEYSPYKPGAAAEPANIEDWKNYVRTVATRYKSRIHYYELWNEPDIKTFYTGSVDQMVILAREAFKILKQVDPTIQVVSPSTTDNFGFSWLEDYLAKGGSDYADIIGFHFYVSPAPPEGVLVPARSVRNIMVEYDINKKPLWNTESGWTKPKLFSSSDEASAYVVRSYILNWALGFNHFYWYSWDDHDWVTLEMTEPDNKTVTAAALAFEKLQEWLVGSKMIFCGQRADGIWITKLLRSDGTTAWIVWNPAGASLFSLPAEMHFNTVQSLAGESIDIRENNQITIGIAPSFLYYAQIPSPPQRLHASSEGSTAARLNVFNH